MPCQDYRDNVPVNFRDTAEYRELKKRLDKVTRLLCTVLTDWMADEKRMEADSEAVVSHLPGKIANNKELQEWWTEHQKSDREREKAEKEALVASAKSKLTKKELQAILDANE